jgi:cleavage stimulation factor subunit 3
MSDSDILPDAPATSEPGVDPDVSPPSDYDALLARLKESPHDPESWKRLVHIAETSNDIDRVTQTYEALLKQYPNTAAAQIAYLEHFIHNPSNHVRAEELLNKFLRPSPSADLWKFYLGYVRRVNPAPAQRETVRKAFDFAINHIGQDRDSGSIWAEYIQFLKAAESSSAWEKSQKMDALRKVYHRAVQIPLDNIEHLWKDLEDFEMDLNKITAKKFMADLSPAYMQARTVLRQLSNHLSGLGLTTSNTNTLFLPSPPTFSAQERPLIGRWKTYLKWEEGNPLEMDDKDRIHLNARIQMVYRKAVTRMRYYPEIW